MIIKYRFSEMGRFLSPFKFKCKSTVVALKGLSLLKQELLVHIGQEPRENLLWYHIIKIQLTSKIIK